jgi:hypothetical protein
MCLTERAEGNNVCIVCVGDVDVLWMNARACVGGCVCVRVVAYVLGLLC